MTGGQEKNFSTLGPKLRENRAQQYYGDKQRQIRVENIDYHGSHFLFNKIQNRTHTEFNVLEPCN